MQYIGTSKIGRLSAKKDKIYAQIRLRPQLTNTIGGVADIFETEHYGKRAFLLVTNQTVLDDDTVLQYDKKVVKPHHENDVESRLTCLESSINEIKNLLFQNNYISNSQSTKENSRKGRGRDSNPSRGLHRAIG